MDFAKLKKRFKPCERVVNPLDFGDPLAPHLEKSGDKDFYEYVLRLEKNRRKIECLNFMIYHPDLTQKEIAEKLGITEKTITQWKSEKFFLELRTEGLSEAWKAHRGNVLSLIYKKALAGDLKAAEMFLKEV